MPRPDGWVAAVDQRATLAAEYLNGRIAKAVQSAGLPWRHKPLSDPAALAKIAEYDQPTPQLVQQLGQLSTRELVASALDAVKRRTRAERQAGQKPGLEGGG